MTQGQYEKSIILLYISKCSSYTKSKTRKTQINELDFSKQKKFCSMKFTAKRMK